MFNFLFELKKKMEFGTQNIQNFSLNCFFTHIFHLKGKR